MKLKVAWGGSQIMQVRRFIQEYPHLYISLDSYQLSVNRPKLH